MPPAFRIAQKTDFSALYSFINSLNYLHRHLDWRDSLEWLGREPFWIMEENRKMQGVFACPPEPADVAWVRLFATGVNLSPDQAWKNLFGRALEDLQNLKPYQ